MTAYLEKNAAENKVFVRTKAGENTKTAALRYRVIDENRAEKLSLVEIELLTGRTHQIRVQMADIRSSATANTPSIRTTASGATPIRRFVHICLLLKSRRAVCHISPVKRYAPISPIFS